MALTDVSAYKAFVGAPASDTSRDDQLAALIPGACAAVLSYCKRNLETAAYTEYLSGNNTPRVSVREYPLLNQTFSGTLTGGSAVVTGLPPTSTLLAGMVVSGAGVPGPSPTSSALPTTVLSVDSTTQITLSANATASGSQSLVFGPGVYLDPRGYYGRAVGAFTLAGSLQIEGLSFVPEYSPDGSCRSGNLIRLAGGTPLSAMAYEPWQWRQGTLTARLPPVWPAGYGNIRVTFAAGLGTGPAASGGTLPEDITLAANMVVSYLKRSAPLGAPPMAENLGSYSYSMQGRLALSQAPDLGEARQLLSRLRRITT